MHYSHASMALQLDYTLFQLQPDGAPGQMNRGIGAPQVQFGGHGRAAVLANVRAALAEATI